MHLYRFPIGRGEGRTLSHVRSICGRAVEPLERRTLFSAAAMPRPDHVVVVVEEDHSYDQILGVQPIMPLLPSVPVNLLDTAPYIRQLAAHSASLTQIHSVGHPNAVTYQALFSGLKTPGVALPYTAPNLASELNAAGLSFGGYSESLPHTGYSGYDVGDYKLGHNPWAAFSNVPGSENMPFSRFPSDYSKLPTVSYVVPNLQNNMHSGYVSTADQWLHDNIGGYAKWAMSHNSLLIVTWDESHQTGNQVPTFFYGPMIEPGNYGQRVTQLNLLRTLEDMYGLAPTGQAAQATAISDVFGSGGLSESFEDAVIKARPHGGSGHASIHGKVVSTTGRPLSRWWVYLDANNDGVLEPGEQVLRTDSHGRFTFRHLSAGTYDVRVVPQNGLVQTSPANGVQQIPLTTGQHVSGILFSEQPIPVATNG